MGSGRMRRVRNKTLAYAMPPGSAAGPCTTEELPGWGFKVDLNLPPPSAISRKSAQAPAVGASGVS
jgi:hypothetical protein